MIPSNKEEWRALLKNQRSAISSVRRERARDLLFETLLPLLPPSSRVLSFCSLPLEIATSVINAHLEKTGQLLLPRVSKETLEIYRVFSIEKELVTGTLKLQEPDPNLCTHAHLSEASAVLVPGLGFDSSQMRIGYGKGHYDRLIALLKNLPKPPLLIGIGFLEQLVPSELPAEAHDQPLDKLILV